ncbi:MAG: cyclic nucleotide-binding domain-containing protein [Deltaproteobacteria bacterium]
MFIPNIDLFKDLRQEAIDDISQIAVEETYDKGTILFSPGQPAHHFYILVDGKVRIGIGKNVAMDYVVERLGEAFGWSSVVDREAYSAEAQCVEPSRCLKIEKDSLERVFDAHERSGRKFYKRLAAERGRRLIDLHA